MIYTNDQFTGFWPVGSAAIVEAESKDQAALLLMKELDKIGLPQTIPAFDMQEFNGGVIILNDGNY